MFQNPNGAEPRKSGRDAAARRFLYLDAKAVDPFTNQLDEPLSFGRAVDNTQAV